MLTGGQYHKLWCLMDDGYMRVLGRAFGRPSMLAEMDRIDAICDQIHCLRLDSGTLECTGELEGNCPCDKTVVVTTHVQYLGPSHLCLGCYRSYYEEGYIA